MKQVSDESFEKDVLGSDVPVLVDFWAEWCGPCRQIAPILDEIEAERDGKLTIVKVNIDDNPDTPQKYGVRGIPTMMIFREGRLVDAKIGALPKSKLLEWVDQTISVQT